MRGQHFVQQLRAVVEREADVLYKALFFLVADPAEAIKLIVRLNAVAFYVVDEVVIKIRYARLSHLLIKNAVAVFKRIHECRMQLCRQREAVARMAGNKCFLYGVFAFECAVHPRRVKIREAALDERIHHFLDLLNVNLARVVRVQRRQTHEAEA